MTSWIGLLLGAASCRETIVDCWPASLEVITETTGTSPDMDGYELVIPGSDSTFHLDPNGLRSIYYGADGDFHLELGDVAPNCSVVGGATRDVQLARCLGGHYVTFEIVCADRDQPASAHRPSHSEARRPTLQAMAVSKSR